MGASPSPLPFLATSRGQLITSMDLSSPLTPDEERELREFEEAHADDPEVQEIMRLIEAFHASACRFIDYVNGQP